MLIALLISARDTDGQFGRRSVKVKVKVKVNAENVGAYVYGKEVPLILVRWYERRERCVVRGAWCVMRGAWCVVRDARCSMVHAAVRNIFTLVVTRSTRVNWGWVIACTDQPTITR